MVSVSTRLDLFHPHQISEQSVLIYLSQVAVWLKVLKLNQSVKFHTVAILRIVLEFST